jgi:hypothetical protein
MRREICKESSRGIAEQQHSLKQRRQLSMVCTVYVYDVPERVALAVSLGDTRPFGE